MAKWIASNDPLPEDERREIEVENKLLQVRDQFNIQYDVSYYSEDYTTKLLY